MRNLLRRFFVRFMVMKIKKTEINQEEKKSLCREMSYMQQENRNKLSRASYS